MNSHRPVQANRGAIRSGIRSVIVNVLAPILLAWLGVRLVHDHFYPPAVSQLVRTTAEHYGAITMRIKLPGTAGGIPEPLIVYGQPGDASLVFIRLLHKGRAQVGIEFWGLEKIEGEQFDLPAPDAEIVLTCYVPALFPKVGDAYWGNISPDLQRARNNNYLITVNGVVRLKGPVSYGQDPSSYLYFGSNPIGGSYVSNRFTGKILSISQPR